MHNLGTKQRIVLVLGIAVVIVGGVAYVERPSPDTTPQLRASLDAYNNNDFVTALKQINAVLAKDPNNINALLAEATTLAQEASLRFQENIEAPQAIQIAQRVLELDPKNSEAWRIIGYANEIMQKYDDAHAAYAKAVELNQYNTLAISQDAHAYDLEGKLDKAEAGYRKALAINPVLDQANAGLARILLGKNDVNGALSLFVTVASSSPNARVRAEAAYSAGVIENAKGDSAASERYMRLATTVDPSYALGWVGVGTVEFQTAMATSSALTIAERNQHITTSMLDLQRAISLNTQQSAAYIQLGAELIIIGKKEQGIQILNEVKNIIANDITLSAPGKESALRQVSALLEGARKK